MIDVQAIAKQIDAHFDAQEYEGMPTEIYRAIEAERVAAHDRLLSMALDSQSWGKVRQA